MTHAIVPILDVLVAGAGPAGSAVARLLASAGLRVALVDRTTAPEWRPIEMLPPSASNALSALGVLPALVTAKAVWTAFGIRRAWGTPAIVVDDFVRRPGSSGWLVDRARFDRILREQAHEAGAIPFDGFDVHEAVRVGETWEAVLRGPATTDLRLHARALVDATGRCSRFARRLGARRWLHDPLVAVVQTGGGGVDGWLTVRSRPNGWIYDGNDGTAIAIGTGGAIAKDDGRAALAASSTCLSHAAGPCWLAIGDAACAFDPIAGQGLAQALASAFAAARILEHERGADLTRVHAYTVAIHRTWAYSERVRHQVYAAERRWPATPFWQRRTRVAAAFVSAREGCREIEVRRST